jgi:hypothetical protein
MGEEERRRYKRTRKHIRVQFQKRRFHFMRGPRDTADALDISGSGARINTRMELVVGDSVRLMMQATAAETPLAYGGKVVWIKPVTEEGHTFSQAGVAFSRLSVKQRVLLVRLAAGV